MKDIGRSKTFSEPHRARTRTETTSVLFILHIDLKIYISFVIIKTLKIIYTVPTLVLTRVCLNMGDIMSTPQPLFPSYQLPYSLGEVNITSPHMRPLVQIVHRGPQYYVISPGPYDLSSNHVIYIYISIRNKPPRGISLSKLI